jgi:hypothetical protein
MAQCACFLTGQRQIVASAFPIILPDEPQNVQVVVLGCCAQGALESRQTLQADKVSIFFLNHYAKNYHLKPPRQLQAACLFGGASLSIGIEGFRHKQKCSPDRRTFDPLDLRVSIFIERRIEWRTRSAI